MGKLRGRAKTAVFPIESLCEMCARVSERRKLPLASGLGALVRVHGDAHAGDVREERVDLALDSRERVDEVQAIAPLDRFRRL